ncbi:MAG TPA: L-lactate permease [Euzebyales bacterium]
MNGPPLTATTWLIAAAPVLCLLVVVLTGWLSARAAAALVLALAAVSAAVAFGAGAEVLLVATGKGLWLGTWILGVVWPALLLYGVASSVGLERIGRVLTSVLPRREETLLLLAWVFPSFLQGVAGFGTPIAVCAPLLVAAGWRPTHAVAAPLIGYHWSVTFGSMGSSFYMASLTAQLDAGTQTGFALAASTLLALQCLAAGTLVLAMDGGLAAVRAGRRMLAVVGLPMAGVLVGVAALVPAVASLAAGTAGLAGVAMLSVLDRRRGTVPVGDDATQLPSASDGDGGQRPLQVLAPYLVLLVTALPVFLIPASRAWVTSHLVLAPDFPATSTAIGWTNAAVNDYTPFPLFGHPGFYVVLASLVGYLTYRMAGLWASDGDVVRTWARSLPRSSIPILLLAVLATVMADTGMVSVLARGIARVTGPSYPALAPVMGGLGSFMTGSTTTSNALFSGLQRDIASLLGLDPAILLAAQTAGGNIGNSLAPVVALIGLTTLEGGSELSDVARRSAGPAVVLFVLAATVTMLRV